MASRKDFNGNTNGSEVAAAFADRIKGRTIVITGVSPKSIGGTLAINLAAHEPEQLILASRTSSNLQSVIDTIKSTHQYAKVSAVSLDLSSQASVRSAAKEIASLSQKVDLLINTAAVSPSSKKTTAEGIESQLGVTHIGHFLLANLLLPQIKAAASSNPFGKGSTRIINVSSHGHRLSPFRFHDYNFEGKQIPDEEQPPQGLPEKFLPTGDEPYAVFVAYGQSKTANVLHALELDKRLEAYGIRGLSLHPGSIITELGREMTAEDWKVIESTSTNWVSLDQGTSTILVAALDPALDTNRDGVYLADCQLSEASKHAVDPDAAKKLWDLSEALTTEGSTGGQVVSGQS
ncbi:Short chain dehydrogenase-like protein 10 [Elsinoe fawcettii]|nr:Short chain dehydrogenase-like protein 10 [Elsinoe fawcettii]